MDNVLGDLMQSARVAEFGLTEFAVSVVFSLLAGVICTMLYRLYFSTVYDRNESLARSFAIIAPSISAIFWAIQYSLPLSLGLLGALSFVRFRTPVKKAEDIGFILLVIAISLLSSVFRFKAAGILLAVMASIVAIKAFWVDRRMPGIGGGTYLTVFCHMEGGDMAAVNGLVKAAIGPLKTPPREFTLHDAVAQEGGYNLRYSLRFGAYDDSVIPEIVGLLGSVQGLSRVEVFVGKIQ